MDQFINRSQELAILDALTRKSGLVVVYGRRRIGKTRLLTEWLKRVDGIYVQAIEGTETLQLAQIYEDIQVQYDFGIVPKTWSELFRVLETFPGKLILAIDEFPYLTDTNKSVASQFQKWLDHRNKQDVLLILSGSSQKMMHDEFLNRNAPLYGRAIRELQIGEMDYAHFCRALRLKSSALDSFVWFATTGGVPWYWTLMESGQSLLENLERLFFGPSAILENEARKLLSDEKISGLVPLSVLEIIGKGASRPSEIAARLGVPQTQLSKTFAALVDGGFIRRDLPFGDTKNGLYVIRDSLLQFWFKVCSPHRARWPHYDDERKMDVLRLFASHVFEQKCRELFPGVKRYWDRHLEFDGVVPVASSKNRVHVIEAKFTQLRPKERASCLQKLADKWQGSQLANRGYLPEFEIIDFPAYIKHIT